ncbi:MULTISPECIES: sensor histidine kinase [Hyphobacterium]|uniref:Sensor histidine kinase n=1 Tax=Hyphobacterium vulgare TaxID=1736751 RepID=A0ABV7A188_9PROT
MSVVTGSRIIDRLRRSNLVRLLGATLVVQLLFWLGFNPIFIQPATAPVEFYEVTQLSVAEPGAPDATALARAQFRPIDPQPSVMFPIGYSAVRAEIELEQIPSEGLAMLDQNGGDNSQIYVNGQLLHGEGEMRLPGVTYHALTRQIIRIPPAMLVTGTNRIDTLRVFDMPQPGANFPSLFGNYDEVTSAFGWRAFLLGPARIISLTTGCVLALFIFVALLRAQRRTLLVWLLLLTVSWAMRSHFLMWVDMPLHGFDRGLYYAVATLFLSACWPILIDAWSDRPIRFFKPAMLAIFAAAAAVIAWWLMVQQDNSSWDRSTDLIDKVGMIFMAIMLGRVIWHFLTTDDERHWEGAILLTLGLTVAIFLVNIILWGRNTPYLTITQPLMLLAFSMAFFARNFRLFQSSAQISALLQTQLDERTAELAQAHAREKELVRLEAHGAERQRILRDMHDGLGSQLMSMLMMAKRGKASQDAIVEGIQSVIDEMRLMIDSMDSVGESLSSALAIFRRRMVPRIEAAGFTCVWQMAEDCPLPDYGPRDVLQIFRILQEAVTNALKHSGGDRITIAIRPGGSTDHPLRITIADNGAGLTASDGRGRGLVNMRARARSLHAGLDISGAGTGSQVALDLPAGQERHR